VAKANELLSTDFSVFTHLESGMTSIRTLAYSIPRALQGHIDFVHPTTSFTRPLASRAKFAAVRPAAPSVVNANPLANAVPASCATLITPACLQVISFRVFWDQLT
jgi:tripeptidyl-peptidase-1